MSRFGAGALSCRGSERADSALGDSLLGDSLLGDSLLWDSSSPSISLSAVVP